MDEATRLMPRFYLGSAPSRNPGYTYIVLCAVEYQPDGRLLAPVRLRRIPLEDTDKPLSEELQAELDHHALRIADAWEHGHRVLVSCVMGRNRSALVSSLALSAITGRHPGDCALDIRTQRIDPNGVPALQNNVFWEYLQNYPTT